MSSPSEVKFEIGHVLVIAIVGRELFSVSY